MNKHFTHSEKAKEKARNNPSKPDSKYGSMLMELEQRIAFDAAVTATAVNQLQDDRDTHKPDVNHEAADTAPETDSDALAKALAESVSPPAPDSPLDIPPRQVVVIDSSVPDYQSLLEGIKGDFDIIVLSADEDGITQMATAMAEMENVSAVHIISHGDEGRLYLGKTELTIESMADKYAGELRKIGSALADKGDILVYGCDFAKGEVGQNAARMLNYLTGADVTASIDATGNKTQGGNWDLEYRNGAIESAALLSAERHGDYETLLNTSASIGNGAMIVATGRSMYSVDFQTGKATIITTVPGSVGGVSLSDTINSLAVDHANGLIYYTDNDPDNSNRALFAYDYVNNSHILIDSNITNNGAGLSVTVGERGVGSGAATFYNGSLYLGIESVNANGDDRIWRVTFSNNGRTIASAATFGGLVAGNNDWGDFTIDPASNALLSINSTTITRYDLATAAIIGTAYANPGGNQGTADANGNTYVVGSTTSQANPFIQRFNPTTGAAIGSTVAITTNGSTAIGAISDASRWVPPTASIGDKVYDDNNRDGIFNTGDAGIANVTVQLIDDVNGNGVADAGERILGTDTTDADGNYLFTGVLPGQYVVRVTDTNSALSSAPSTTGGATQSFDLTRVGGTYLAADFGYNAQAPIIDLNSGTNPSQIIGNGANPGGSNWSSSGTGQTANVNANSGWAWIGDQSTGTLTQTGVTGWNDGLAPSGAAQLTFDMGWSNPVAFDNSTPSTLEISIDGVVYARVTTGTTTGSINTATIAYLNGATGFPATLAASTFGSWTRTPFTLNLPSTVSPIGDLVFSFSSIGPILAVGKDDIFIDNISAFTNVDAVGGYNYSASYIENGAGVSIADAAATVRDLDSANMRSATITLTNAQAGDLLNLGSLPAGITGTIDNSVAGQITINLSGSASKASYATAIRNITFSNSGDNPSTTQRVINVTVSDGGLTSPTAVTTINVTAINDDPVNTLPAGGWTTLEDNNVNLTGLAINDLDAGTGTMTTTLSVASGRILAAAGSGVTVTGSGTGTVTITGTLANINTYLATSGALVYAPVADAFGNVTLTMNTSDGGNTGNGGVKTDTDTATITITPVNDTPVLDLDSTAAGTGFSTSYTEQAASIAIVGNTALSDVDNTTMSSATVVITNGQAGDALSILGGLPAGIIGSYNPATFTLTLSGSASVAAYQTALGQVRFASTSDDPTRGGTVTARSINVTVNDGAANSNTAMSTIAVTAVNDAPTNTMPASWTTLEDTNLALNGLSVTDLDAASGTITVRLDVTAGAITATSGSGVTISGSGSTSLTLTGTLASINAYLGSASAPLYVPVPDSNAPVTLTMTTNDGGNTGTGGALTATTSRTITITPVNDAPTLDLDGTASGTGYSTSYTENAAPIAIAAGNAAIADVDNANMASASIVITNGQAGDELSVAGTLPSGITFTYNSSTYTLTLTGAASKADYQTALAQVRYASNSENPSTVARAISVTVNDSAANSNTAIASVNVIAVNDAPVNTVPAPVTVSEDVLTTINGLSVNDVDNNTVTVTLTVQNGTLTPSATGGTITGSGTGTVTLSGTLAQVNAVLASMQYKGNADFNGSDTLTMTTSDGSLTDTDTVAITVTAVRDATDDTITTDEDTPRSFNVITGTNGATADTFSNAGRTLTAVTQPPAGQGTVTFAANGMITYTPSANFNGTTSFTYTVTSGGITETATVTVNVTAVNDAPVNTLPASGWTTNEDTAVTLTGLSIADVDAGNSPMTVTLAVTSGSLAATSGSGVTVTGSGTSITLTGTFANINAYLASSAAPVYTPVANANGTATLTMTTSDNGSTGSGGTLTDVDTRPITISAVNDAPVNTLPPTFTVAEDNPLALNGISVNDVDAGTGNITVTLSVNSGALAATSGSGVTVSGSGTTTITLTGTLTSINAYLSSSAQPVFTPAPDYNGNVTLTMVTNDGGNTGSGGALTDTDTSVITVTPVDDTPTLDLDASGAGTGYSTSYTEKGTAVAIVDTDVLITDVDNTTMASASIYISNGKAGDVLSTLGALPAGITASWNAATYTLTLSGTASKADYQTALTQVRYATTSNNPDTSPRLINITVNDGTANSNTAVSTVQVIAVNDAPVNVLPATYTMNEDGTLRLSGMALNDPDANGSVMTVTLSVNSGKLSALSTTQVTISGNNTSTLTFFGTQDAINAWLANPANQPLYTPNADFNGPVTLTMSSTDGTLTDTDTSTITVAAEADIQDDSVTTPENAPIILDVNANDSFENAGHTITAINNTAIVANGVVTVSNGVVRLNANGTLTFTPNTSYNGTTSFTYTVTSGGVTETATVTVNVTPINDAPVNTVPGAQTTAEDTDKPITGVTVTDVDGDNLITTLTVTNGTLLVSTGGSAVISGNGSGTVTISGSAAQVNAALAGLVFRPRADYNGSAQLTVSTTDGTLTDTDTVGITVTAVSDITNDTITTNEDTPAVFNVITGTGGATADNFEGSPVLTSVTQPPTGQGSVIFNADGTITYTPPLNYNGTTSFTYTVTSGGVTETATVTMNVTPVNDAPVNTVPPAQTFTEDTTLVFSPGNGNTITVSDVDNTTLTVTLTVTNGRFNLSSIAGLTFTTGDGVSDTTMTFSGTAAAINAALAGAYYAPTADYNGPAQISLSTSDGSLTTNSTIALNITAVSDITDDTASTDQNTAVAIAVLANDNFENAGRTITAINGTAIAAGGSVAVTNGMVQLTADGQLVFNPNTGYNGVTNFTYTVTSGGATETATVTVAVASVNSPPVNSLPPSFNTLEDTGLRLDGLSIADSDAGSGNVTVTLNVNSGRLNATGASGVTITGSGTGEIVLNGTVSAINAFLAGASRPTFTPASNAAGSVTLTMTTNDNGNTGGIALSDIDTATITVTPVNDAPSGANNTVTFNEDTTYTFNANDFGFTDANDSPGNALAAVIITTLPTNGTLALGGVPVTAGQAIPAANIGNLTFTPTANANGNAWASFTFQVRDNGGKANGGEDTDQSPNTITFNVTAVNDAPVNTLPPTFVTNEDTALRLSGLSVSDVDATTGSITVTLSVNSGLLSAANASGVTVTGSGTGTLVLNGTAANINTFLAGAARPAFTPAANANGSVTLTMVTNDNGNAGSGGALSDTDTSTITVTPVNDAPVGSNTSFSTAEDTPYNGTLPAATDVDGDALTYGVGGTAPTHGTVTINPDGTYRYTPASNYNGSDTFTYTVTDGTATSEYTVTVAVTAVNDAPVATNDNVQTPANSNITVNVLTNDTDVDGDTLSVSAVNGASGSVGIAVPGTNGGSFIIAADGTATFIPNGSFADLAAGQTRTTAVTYQAADGNGGFSTATLTVTVTGVNDAPIATNIANQAGDDGDTISFNVSGNFSDPDAGDTLTYSATGLPAGLSINPNTGVISGTIASNASTNAPYSVIITATDSSGAQASNSFVWTVGNPAPIAQNDALTTTENANTSGSVFGNNGNGIDRDPDGDSISVSAVGGNTAAVGQPIAGSNGGTFTINADGTYLFQPGTSFDDLATGQNRTTAVTYTISDGQGGFSTATVTVTVTGENDAPVLGADSFTTNEDTAVTFDVLGNDSDVDGGTLTITQLNGNVVTAGSTVTVTGGTVTLNANGTLTFTPTANYNGSPSFTYTVSDGQGSTSTQTVSGTVVAVQDAPTAANDSYTTPEDTPFVFDVRVNDNDMDGDPLAVTQINGVALVTNGSVTVEGGRVTLRPDGQLSFTPTADYNGTLNFDYTLSDGQGGTANATVTITVTAVQDAPRPVNDAFATPEDVPVTFDVLGNDTDPDGDTLTITRIGTTAVTAGETVTVTGGTVTLNANGTLTFTPNANYNGSPSFTYTVDDGQGNTAVATVNGTVMPVNDAPVATPGSFTAVEDTPVTFDVRDNVTDVDGDPLTVTQINGNAIAVGANVAVTGGTITLNANGTLTFTPAPNYNGAPSFTYTVSDGQGGTATGSMSGTVTAVDDAPVATNDSFTIDEDTTITLDVLANDAEYDGDPLTITAINGTAVTVGVWANITNGRVLLNADGRLSFMPNANYNGPISFTYTISDGISTSTGTVSGTVTAVNDAPVSTDITRTMLEDGVLNGNLNASDADGDTITFSAGTTTPAHGTVVINPDGTYTYTPAINYTGTDRFSFVVTDPSGARNEYAVTVTITNVNDAPVSAPIPAQNLQDGTAVNYDVSSFFNDADGDALAYSATGLPNGLSINTQGVITGTISNFASLTNGGIYNVTVNVDDGNGGTTSRTFTMTITNPPPVAVNDTATTAEDTAVTIDVLTNDSDPDGDPLFVSEAVAANGTVIITEGNQLIYIPNANFNGTDTITYTISDGNGGFATATVTVTVIPENDAPDSSPIPDRTRNDGATDSIDLNAFFSDVEGDTITYTVTGLPDGLVLNGSVIEGQIAPGASQASGEFVYKVVVTASDANGGTTTREFNYTVLNIPPNAADDFAATDEDTPVNIYILDNDDDPDGDISEVIRVNNIVLLPDEATSSVKTAHGTVFLQTDGLGKQYLRFIPDADYNGVENFTYSIDDGNGGIDTASVNITINAVNDAPQAVNGVPDRQGGDNQPFNYNVGNYFTDVEGDSITYSVTGLPAGLTFNPATGVISGTLAPDASLNSNNGTPGEYDIEIVATDSNGASSAQTFTLVAKETTPVANDDTATTNEDTTLNNIDVLSNDTDPDGLTLSIDESVPPTALHGTVTVNPDGTLNYTPNANFYGTDTITYTITNGNGGTNTGTVTVTVIAQPDAPVAAVIPDTQRNDGDVITFDISGYFTDPDSETMTYAVSGLPAGLTYNATTGIISGRIDPDASGPTGSFIYEITVTATDSTGRSTDQTFSYTVINVAPNAENDTGTTVEDTAVEIDVLANDTDPDGDTDTVILVNNINLVLNGPTVRTTHGTVQLILNASNKEVLLFTPDANYNGTESFTYTISDPNGGKDTATVTVNVTAVNDAPTATPIANMNVSDGASINFDASTHFSDIDGDTLTYSIDNLPTGLSFNTATGRLTGTLANDASLGSPYTITITASDGTQQASSTFVFAVSNPIPVANNDTVAATEDTDISFNPITGVGTVEGAPDTDSDNDPLTLLEINGQTVTAGQNITITGGTLTINALNGDITFTPAANYNGPVSFVYRISDGNGGFDDASVTINVAAVNDAPTVDLNGGTAGTDLNVSYTEGDLPVLVAAPDALVADVENGLLALNITLGGFTDGGQEVIHLNSLVDIQYGTAVSGTIAFGGGNFRYAYNGANTLSITNADGSTVPMSNGAISALMRAVQYSNRSEDPTAGQRSFTFTATDNEGATSAPAVTNVAVTGINDAPIALNDTGTTDQNTTITNGTSVLANDSDPEGDSIAITFVNGQPVNTPVAGSSGGTFTIRADGTYDFNPGNDFLNLKAGESRTTYVDYTVSDGNGGDTIARLTITVNGLNDAPQGANSSITVDEDTPYTDNLVVTDADGDTLTFAVATPPQNGTVSIDANGRYTYTPANNFSGSDTFTYTVTDGTAIRTYTVNVTVDDAQDAPVGSPIATQSFDDAASVTLDVSSSFSDPDGDTLTFIANGLPTGLSMNAQGVITGTVAGDASQGGVNGVYTVTVTADDGQGNTTDVTFTMTISNPAPIAYDDAATTDEDSVVTGSVLDAAGAADDDMDPDGDPLTISAVNGTGGNVGSSVAGSHGGTFTINDDGSYSFDPRGDFDDLKTGETRTTFVTYTLTDGQGGTDMATLTITVTGVNDAPQGSGATVSVGEDSSVVRQLPVATDAEGSPLTYAVGTQPDHGTLVINPDGSYTYTPDPDYNGADSFTYTVSDGTDTSTYTITLNVTAVNDAPVLQNETITLDEDTVYTGQIIATDPDDAPSALQYSLASQATNGTVIVNGDGTYTYTPIANFNGTDSFEVTVRDAAGETSTARITVTVTPVADDPIAVDDTATTTEKTPITGNVIAGSDFHPDGQPMSVITVGAGPNGVATPATGSSGGTFTIWADGTYTFDPAGAFNDLAAGQSRTTFITYTLADGQGGTDTATLTVTVTGENDAPDAPVLPPQADVDGGVVNYNAGAAFSDVDSTTLTFTANGLPTGLSINATTGLITGTIASGASGATGTRNFNVTVVANDSDGGTTSRTFVWTVTNPPPVAVNDSFSVPQEGVLNGSVLTDNGNGADYDPDGDSLGNVTVVTGPANGTLVLRPNGTFTYTPDASFRGTDSFVYQVRDANGGVSTATSTITVTPVNHAPVVQNDSFIINEDGTATLNVLANDSDSDGDPLSITRINNQAIAVGQTVTIPSGTIRLNADGTLTYTPNANYNGLPAFTYTASDGTTTAQGTVSGTVRAVNDAPVNTLPAGGFFTDEDVPVQLSGLSISDVDAATGTMTVTLNVNTGTLNAFNGSGVTVAGNGTGTITLTGTLTNLNTYLGSPLAPTFRPLADSHNAVTLTMTTRDGGNTGIGGIQTTTDQTTILVAPVNDAPTVYDQRVSAVEDVPFTGNLNATDVDGDALIYVVTTQPANGRVTVDSTGRYVFTPNTNFNGEDSFRITVSDGYGGNTTVLITVDVAPVNDAPIGSNTSITLDEDTPYSNSLPTANDPEGSPVIYSLGAQAAHGTVTVNSDGTYTYTPNANYNGTDSFTYRVSDGTATSVYTVSVTVTAINDAPNGSNASFNVPQGDTATGNLPAALDPEGSPVTYAVGTLPTHGTLTLNADGSYIYTPDPTYAGADSFTYTVSDGNDSNTYTVSITVGAANQPPMASDGSANPVEDEVFNGTLPSATDPDGGGPITYGLGNQATHGTVVVNPDGTYTYTPNANYNGTDSFTFTVSDGNASSTHTITLNVQAVNDAPVGTNTTIAVTENIPAIGTLPRAIDAEGNAITYSVGTQGTRGVVTINPDGTYRYVPNPGANGTDTFTYRVSDGNAVNGSNTYTVTVYIDAVNDAPIGSNTSITVLEDVIRTGTLPVATDPDGDTLTYGLGTQAAHGVVTVNPNGTYRYEPDANYNGSDSFTYTVSDGNITVTYTVNVTVQPVNDAPVGSNDTVSTLEDIPINSTLPVATDVDGDPLIYGLGTQAAHGTVTVNLDGTYRYVPNANYNGTDSFTYTVSDGQATRTYTISIAVGAVNDPPVGSNGSITLNEDTRFNGRVPIATDGDGDALTYGLGTQASNGTVTLNPNGTYSYVPNANFNGTDSFTYTVTDGTSTVTYTIAITVNVVNDRPVGSNGAITIIEDGIFNGTLPVATDADGDPLTYSLGTQAARGTVTINPDGTYRYIPNPDFSGRDSFTYRVSDGNETVTYRITVTVVGVNDPPRGSDGTLTVNEDTRGVGRLPVATDPEGGRVVYGYGAGPTYGTVRINADGTYAYTPNRNYNGTDSFTYTISDGTTTANYTITVTVLPGNDAPQGSNLNVSAESDAVTQGTLPPAIDPEGSPVTYGLGRGAMHGTVVVNADGTYTYTPTAGYEGADSFTYTVSDGSASSTYTVYLTVEAPPNLSPVGADASVNASEDTPLNGTLPVATDPEGRPVSYGLGAQAIHGTVQVNADGTYTYLPNRNFSGTDYFTYTISDGKTTAVYTITITVAPMNDAPMGSDGAIAVTSGTSVAGRLPLAIDPDGDPITYGLGSNPAHGTLVINPDGTYTYTPAAGYVGKDRFTFTISDGMDTVTYEIAVTVDPVTGPKPPVGEVEIDPPAPPVSEPTDPGRPPVSPPFSGDEDGSAGGSLGEITKDLNGMAGVITENGPISSALNAVRSLNSVGYLPAQGAVLDAVEQISTWLGGSRAMNSFEIGFFQGGSNIQWPEDGRAQGWFLVDTMIYNDYLYVMPTPSDNIRDTSVRITLEDGSPLPAWLSMTREGMLMGVPPVDATAITIRIEGNSQSVRVSDLLRIDLHTGTITALESYEETRLPPIMFSDKLRMEMEDADFSDLSLSLEDWKEAPPPELK